MVIPIASQRMGAEMPQLNINLIVGSSIEMDRDRQISGLRRRKSTMNSKASLLWLESAPVEAKPSSEEHIMARLFASSCNAMGIDSKKIENLQDLDPTPPPHSHDDKIVLIAGNAKNKSRLFFLDLGQRLRSSGANPIFVIDALTDLDQAQKRILLSQLDRERFHVATQETAMKLLKSPAHFFSNHRPSLVASVLIYLPVSNSVVLLARKGDSSDDHLSLPKSSLRTHVEDLPDCAARAINEFSGIRVCPSEMKLIHVNSKPDNDSRSHSVELSYLYFVEASEEDKVRQQLQKANETHRIKLMPYAEALQLNPGSKQNQTLQAAFEQIKAQVGKSMKVVMFKRISKLVGF